MMPGARPGTVLVPQGALIRGPAFILDVVLVSLVVAFALAGRAQPAHVLPVTLAAGFLYFSLGEGIGGATLGKRFFGLRVVRVRDGRPCGLLGAVVRNALRLVDNLLFCLPGIAAMATSPRHQRLGDRAARTMVVAVVPEGALHRLQELLAGQMQLPGATDEAEPAKDGEAETPCPFCGDLQDPDEIVCRYCGHYVNQVTAHAEAEDRAPLPTLYADDRNLRFDALWRLVFADDPESLAAVCDAVSTWSPEDRLLAVQTFAEVEDPRPTAFLELLTHDPDRSVQLLAQDARSRLGAD